MGSSRIAFVNTGRYRTTKGNEFFSDPVHLVAMHNICKHAGHQSKIFQLGAPDGQTSIQQIQEYSPDVLALSFLDPYKYDLPLTHQLCQALDPPPKMVIMGGPDADLDGAFYRAQLQKQLPSQTRLVHIFGPGEQFFHRWVQLGLSTELEASVVSGMQDMSWRHTETGWEVRGMKAIPLDQQDHSRDYDLSAYRGRVSVKWATGCWAACHFCYNLPQRSDYKSPQLAATEAQQLKQLGATMLDVTSPQFTAHPAKAAALVGALPKETPPVSFTSRVDSLYHSVDRYPEEWQHFANSQAHQIDIGLESFLPARLVRLNKYRKLQQARLQSGQLDALLRFFQHTKTALHLYLIPLDWQMDLEEARQENDALTSLLEQWPEGLYISPDNIGKRLSHAAGSHFSNQMSPMDFLRFERDPRLLLLCYITDWMFAHLLTVAPQLQEPEALVEETKTHFLCDMTSRIIKQLTPLTLPADFLERALHQLRHDKPPESVVQELIALLPFGSRLRLKFFLDSERRGAKKRMRTTLDHLLTAKVQYRRKYKQ